MDSKTKIYAIFFVLVSARLGFQLLVWTETWDHGWEETPLILIDGNAALDSFCSGNGTDGLSWETAHQITGREAYYGHIGILLKNISRYLVVRNFELYGDYYHYYWYYDSLTDSAIRLQNCTHVKIVGCNIVQSATGICIENSSDVHITDNTFSYTYLPVNICHSQNNILLNNLYTEETDWEGWSEEEGVSLTDSAHNTLVNNTFFTIRLARASNNTLANNSAISLDLYLSSNNTLVNNTAFYLHLYLSSNNTLVHNSVPSIILDDANNNTLFANEGLSGAGIILAGAINNTCQNNSVYGIDLDSAQTNTFKGNTLGVGGFDVDTNSWNNSIDLTNKVHGLSVLYFENQTDLAVMDLISLGQLILVNCNHSTVANLSVSDVSIGILCIKGENNTISNVTCTSNSRFGIFLQDTANITLSDINASNGGTGVYLATTINTTLVHSQMVHNQNGVGLSHAVNTTVSNANASFNSIGLYTRGSNGTLVWNSVLESNQHGIALHYSLNTTMSNNTVSSIFEDIDLGDSNGNVLVGNNMSGEGLFLEGGINNVIDTTNKLDGMSIYYFEEQIGGELKNPGGVGQAIIINCSNFAIAQLGVSGTIKGITVDACKNLTIEECTVTDNDVGIWVRASKNVTLRGNVAVSNGVGIYIIDVEENLVSNNNASNNDRRGIEIEDAAGNVVSNNTAVGNEETGIFMDDSVNNTLVGNNVSYNGHSGIQCEWSDSNLFSGNYASHNDAMGFRLYDSDNNTIVNNNVSYNSWTGFYLGGSDNNNIVNNNASQNGAMGFDVVVSDNNTIVNNNASYNGVNGIELSSSDGNVITGNFLRYNAKGCIVQSEDCDSNEIHDNDCEAPVEPPDWPIAEVFFAVGAIALASALYFAQKRGSQKSTPPTRKTVEMPLPPVTHLGFIEYHGTKFYPVIKNKKVTVDLASKGIIDLAELEGLEKLVDLQVLKLDDNKITKITHLKLPHLQELSLARNQIAEITGLNHVPSLRILNLSENQITEIGGLTHVPFLQHLNLKENHISILQGLGHLPWLQNLWLEGNPLYAWAKRFYGGPFYGSGDIARPRLIVNYCAELELGSIPKSFERSLENANMKISFAKLLALVFGIFFVLDFVTLFWTGGVGMIYLIMIDPIASMISLMIVPAIERAKIFSDATKPQWDALAAKQGQAP